MKIKCTILILSILCLFLCAVSAQSYSLNALLSHINKDSLKRTVRDMESFESRLCTKTEGQNRKVAQYLVDRLQTYGIENARIDSFHTSGAHWLVGNYDQYMYNVIGTLHGTGTTDSTVIIGAHLDAISYEPGWILTEIAPGADDNATGCAVMIEVARIMFEKNIKPHHNIDFMAYDAEEIGLEGAYYDAEKRRAKNEKIILMLNNDMVGNQAENKPWRVSLRWYENSLDITEKAEEALYKYTSVTPIRSETPNSAGSDSYAYFKSGYKVNFAIEEDFTKHYHSVNDVTDSLNFEYCRQIAKMNFVLLDYYAGINLPLSIKHCDPNPEHSIAVYPNPVKETIYFYINNDIKIDKIEILDVMGKLIFSESVQIEQQHSIPLNNFKNGLYIVRVSTNNGIVSKKIIKN